VQALLQHLIQVQDHILFAYKFYYYLNFFRKIRLKNTIFGNFKKNILAYFYDNSFITARANSSAFSGP